MTVAPEVDGAGVSLAEASALSVAQAFTRLASDPAGLTSAAARERLVRVGPNLLTTRKVRASMVLVRQLRSPILILLLGAALVSALTGDVTNGVIIAVIVALSVGLGFINEYAAEVAMASLRAKISRNAQVRRDGSVVDVAVADLVPGDVVVLRIGTIVPADLRLVEVSDLQCDEAVLTGESLPVTKSVDAITVTSPQDLPGCAFMGTIVHQGSAEGVVTQTGTRTEFGRIAAGVAEDAGKTAFEVGLARFSRFLFIVAAVLTTFIFAVNVALSRPLIDALLFSLAIAVGIAPEMMPAIVTVSLATGSKALAAKKVLVKRLVAIEDLGNIEMLFTDKTGTLTEGQIVFERSLDATGADQDRPLWLGLVCNEASMSDAGPVGGNSLDQALWAATAGGARAGAVSAAGAFTRRAVVPFDHERQLVSVLVAGPDATVLVVVKGAPETVLERCVGVEPAAHAILDGLFAQGSRVVAVATRVAPPRATTLDVGDERDLTLEGFLTFADRVKGDAAQSIATLQRLGVEVKIITGDNGLVAATVCTAIGLDGAALVNGSQLDALSDEALGELIPTTTVFARITPNQKSRIIKVARAGGRDVGYMGDGINDAVALHHADVGISVDSGTDVAKDAADVVLLDKDLGVLAEGVVEGRRIFANTMKYVLMATSSNFGNMFSAAGASIFLTFLPMLPSQILLNNLLYDAGQLVIPTDRVDDESLTRPAAWDMRFIRLFMSIFGPISSIFDFLTFWMMISLLHAGHDLFRTGWFVESLATQTLIIYIIRTRRVPFFSSRPSRPMMIVPVVAAAVGAVLPYTGLAHLLGFAPLPVSFFFLLGAMVVVYLSMVEGAKTFFYRAAATRPPARPATSVQRLERRILRRASRFVSHEVPRLARGRDSSRGRGGSTTPPG